MADHIPKLYYSISEVAARTGLDPHVLRYWEGEFPLLQPRKNRSGRRVYTADDIATVERIQRLLRDDKYTIEGARQRLESEAAGEADALREQLVALRAFLRRLLASLE